MDRIKKEITIPKVVQTVLLLGLYIYFWCSRKYYFHKGYLWGRIAFVTIVTVFLLGLIWWKRRQTENRWLKQLPMVLAFFLPLAMFFLLEYANFMQNPLPWEVRDFLNKQGILFGVFLLYLLGSGIFLITNSPRVMAGIFNTIICIFGVASYYVYKFRGIPMLAPDLTTMGTAMNVMGGYDYTPDYPRFILIFLSVALVILIIQAGKYDGWKKKVRLPMLAVYAVCFGISVYLLVFTNFMKTCGIHVNNFRPDKSYSAQGMMPTFVRSIRFLIVEKPGGYSVEAAEAVAEPYRAAENNDEYVKPNVIIVMDEAFTNLANIYDFETSEEVAPVFDGLRENTVRGNMYVSSFGGKTANTEFEILTGTPIAFFPESTTPYQIYIKGEIPSLARTMLNREYSGINAMHPYKPNGYDRWRVYPYMGFNRFISSEDFENPHLVRNFISDKAAVERIISEYETEKAKSDDPFFMFTVTMQNHSAFDRDFDNLPRKIEVLEEEYASDQMERYLNLVHLSDAALGQLIEYFENVDEPTVVMFFGDHQPELGDKFYKNKFPKDTPKEEMMKKYEVPFIIWANYDIEEKYVEKTSANYMTALMMEATGQELTPYQKFQLEIAKDVPALTRVGYYGADGKYYEVEDKKSPYYETLRRYNILQYNYMFDEEGQIQNFFE